MVGDDEGVVCIPRHVVEQIAQNGLEMEELEAFVLEKVQAGAPISGTYPPSESMQAEYHAWKKKRAPVR